MESIPDRSGYGDILYLCLEDVQTYLVSARCWWISTARQQCNAAVSWAQDSDGEFRYPARPRWIFHEHSQRDSLQGYRTGQGALQVLCRSREPLWGICSRRQLIEKQSRTTGTWGDPGSLYLASPSLAMSAREGVSRLNRHQRCPITSRIRSV